MRARLRYLWDQVSNSYWFLPGLMTMAAIVLSQFMVRLDASFDVAELEEAAWIVYIGGVDGAREVLSTIAGSMITVAGVVFSITIVALTLASSQFGPRVLSSFMRDQGNQVVLGTFVATYLYSLLVLRVIHTGDEQSAGVVPHLSVTVGVILALLSLGVLIYFIHHVSVSIQAPSLIASIAGDLHHSIETLFPEEAGVGRAAMPASLAVQEPEAFERAAAPVVAHHNGYVEAVDLQGLLELAVEHGLLIRLERRPGQFVSRGTALALVFPADKLGVAEQTIREGIVQGSRRTNIQDVEFPLNQLVEVAVRALSPGINDPFTAITCIDQIGAAMCHLGGRDIPSPYRAGPDGALRLLAARPLTYAGIADTAFHQIRQNASYHAAVYLRLLEAITDAVGCVHTVAHLEPLLHHAELIQRTAAESVPGGADREEIQGRYRELLDVAERRRAEVTGG